MKKWPLILLVVAVGCQKENRIVGTWDVEHRGDQLTTRSVETFREDGSYFAKSEMGREGSTVVLFAEDTGTWKLIGKDRLSVQLTKIDYDIAALIPPDRAKRLKVRLNAEAPKILKEHNAEPPMKLSWVTPNMSKLKSEHIELIYRRRD